MEGGLRRSERRRANSPLIVDLELEEEVVAGPAVLVDLEAVAGPAVLVDLEAEEVDDDIIPLDENEVETLRIVRRRDIEIIEEHPPHRSPPSGCIDMFSDSDSDLEAGTEEMNSSRLPVQEAVAEEEGEEESLPESFEEEVWSREGDAAVVASPNLESSGEFRVSLLKEELVEAVASSSSTSNLAISDIKKDTEGDQSDEIVREDNSDVPVEPGREGAGGKTQIVYVSKPDYSSLSTEEKNKLREQLYRKIAELQGKCKLGQQYQRRYAADTIRVEDGLKTITQKDKNGVLTKLVFKPAECREADEREADPPNQAEKVEKFKGPAWDSQKDVDDFCQNFNQAFNRVNKEYEDKKKAKETARIQKKKNRKNSKDAFLAEVELGDRKKTRLATGTIIRQIMTSYFAGNSSAQSGSMPKRQPRKRKGSEVGTSSGIDLKPVPTLHRRPLSPRPGPSVFKAPLPRLPPPTLRTLKTEDGLSTCPLENDAGWIKKDQWEIEGIIDAKIEKDRTAGKQRLMYKVKWKGWEREHNCWVAEKHILTKYPMKIFWRRFKNRSDKLNVQIDRHARRSTQEDMTYFLS